MQKKDKQQSKQLQITSFFKNKKPIKSSPDSQQNTTDSENSEKRDLKIQEKKSDKLIIPTKIPTKKQESTEQGQNTMSKRQRLQLNKQQKKSQKIQLKNEEKMIQQQNSNSIPIKNENSNNNNNADINLETFLEDTQNSIKSNNNIGQPEKLIFEEDSGIELDQPDVFISEGEEEKEKIEQKPEKKTRKKKPSLDDVDYYQKVLAMTDDEPSEEEQNNKKSKKKKKRNNDDSFDYDGESHHETNSEDESYDDGSDFSSEYIQNNRRSRGGGSNKRVTLANGEPQQRKYRKVILTEDEIENLEFPYEVAANLYLMEPGTISIKQGYHSKYNFFPIGYKCSRQYASCITKDAKTTYTSEIAEGKKNKPLFKVTAQDSGKVISCESSSQCWKQIAEAAKKLNTGSKKVSISGPEMFGLQNQLIQQILEQLPNADKCENYYANQIRDRESNSDQNDNSDE